jgi:hypothetical protein
MAELPLDAVILEAEVPLATIREWAEGAMRATEVCRAGSACASGFRLAAKDVLAILNSRNAPQGVPVHLPGTIT